MNSSDDRSTAEAKKDNNKESLEGAAETSGSMLSDMNRTYSVPPGMVNII